MYDKDIFIFSQFGRYFFTSFVKKDIYTFLTIKFYRVGTILEYVEGRQKTCILGGTNIVSIERINEKEYIVKECTKIKEEKELIFFISGKYNHKSEHDLYGCLYDEKHLHNSVEKTIYLYSSKVYLNDEEKDIYYFFSQSKFIGEVNLIKEEKINIKDFILNISQNSNRYIMEKLSDTEYSESAKEFIELQKRIVEVAKKFPISKQLFENIIEHEL